MAVNDSGPGIVGSRLNSQAGEAVSGDETAREAAERNARAVVAGDITRVMADITPEALTQMMRMGAEAQAAGIPVPTAMPGIDSYEIEPTSESADESAFRVTFRSAAGTATLATTWRRLDGRWKVAGVALVRAEPTSGPGE